jgi:hypothetical protein
MRTFVLASILTVGLASQALAATAAGQHFAVMDTVGNCAVVDTHPSPVSGLKVLGVKAGYPTEADAQKALGSSCKSVIDRA